MICEEGEIRLERSSDTLKVHKIENFFDSDFGICVISLLVMHNYKDFSETFF